MNHSTRNGATLKYNVALEQTQQNGYTARLLAWPNCEVQAATREQALAQIRTQILECLAKTEVVTIEIKPEEMNHPWLKFAGMWADDPTFDDFVEEMEQSRRERNAAWLTEGTNAETSKELASA